MRNRHPQVSKVENMNNEYDEKEDEDFDGMYSGAGDEEIKIIVEVFEEG